MVIYKKINRKITNLYFLALETFLTTTKGKFSFRDSVTMADLFLYPQVISSVEKFGIDLIKYPNLKAIVENLNKIPEFIDTHPKNQPDFS